ncbi:MAG: hypothetical protein QNL04_11535 [SAR324 cluster bacterium]|nr:hypothetical protein [SAR324 cluster bacterium]
MKYLKLLSLTISALLFFAASQAHAIERRQPQFKSDSSYLILPVPYAVPGVGEGIAYTAMAGNFADTYMDVVAMRATGAGEGTFLGLYDLHLIPEFLIVGYDYLDVSQFTLRNYSQRGIKGEADDYTLLALDNLKESLLDVRVTLFERRLEAFYKHFKNETTIGKILDNEGEVQTTFENPSPQASEKTIQGVIVDYTDDYLDPREGIRFESQVSHSPRVNDNLADYNIRDQKLNLYIPVGKDSVWAFHASASDSEVTETGQTDPDEIAQELGLPCAYASCGQDEQDLVDRMVVERSKGTATPLGGMDRLRSYSMDRFQGAHSRYFSTELRVNFANEVKPFDFWIWKDISTSMQWVLFYDLGTVAEDTRDLWKKSANSTGTGLRMVTASGYVYRADVATGAEGANVAMVFKYPW